MKRKLTCPECNHKWETTYTKWIFTTFFHFFNFKKWKDRRLTKCPNCGKRNFISLEKIK